MRTLVLLSAVGALYALWTADWKHVPLLLMLVGLQAILELFPIRIGKMTLTFSYPVLYALALTSGYQATAVLGTLVLIGAQWTQRRAPRNIMLNASSYMLSIIGAGLAVELVKLLNGDQQQLGFYLIKLGVGALAFSLISGMFTLWYITCVLGTAGNRPTFLKLSLVNLLVSFTYSAVLLLLASDPKTATSGQLGLLFFFLPLVGGAVVLHLFSNLTRAKSGLETLFSVSQSISEQLDLEAVLTLVVSSASRLVRGQCGLLYLVQEDGSLKRAVGTIAERGMLRIPAGEGLVGQCAAAGEPLLVMDCTREARLLPGEMGGNSQSMLLVPILIDGKVVGVISLGKKEPYSFTPDDQHMMRIFATHAAVAMKNAQYVEEREKRLLLEERNRLAREMHDGFAQDIAGAILQIEMLRRVAVTEPVLDGLAELQDSLRRSATKVRHSIYSLRPAPYSHVGLAPALRAHLDEVEAQHGLRTRLDLQLSIEQVPPSVARAVFHIVTEAIQNAVKHAEARELVVTLTADSKQLALSVCDDGRGFHFGQMILQAAERHSFGIENLYNLADQVGGMLDIHTGPGQGTCVTLEIPLKEETVYDDSRVAL